MSDPTPAQHRLATAMVNDSAYPELLKGLQDGAHLLFQASAPSDTKGLQEARLLLTAISMLDGALRGWARPAPITPQKRKQAR